MMIGVIVGTYSTFFVASPIAYNLLKKKDIKEQIPEKGKK